MKKNKPMALYKIIQQQGFGTRAYCQAMIEAGEVTVRGELCDDPDALFDLDDLSFTIQGQAWDYAPFVYVLLHKPAGYECSQKPKFHKGILSLLPANLRARDVQPVGRLDVDTTGLLLLSDDGQFIHKNISPKKNVNKVYHATCAEPVTDDFIAQLKTGVLLKDEDETIAAVDARALSERVLELTLSEGKYHQVKRMVVAAGNHVTQLHRISVGEYVLPEDLAVGEWRLI
jgi:16S rRNA pseudouridine516 synthase